MSGRVLITGGAGFLGSHLCERLLADGFSVTCIDNLLTGQAANIAHLQDHPRFVFLQRDVTEPLDIDGPVDVVLHFASPASPKDYARYPIHTLKVGALGTAHTLELALKKGAVFLLASSSEVYGDPQVSPQPEHYWGHVNPIGPRSVYDEAKRFAEAMVMAYHRVHGLSVRIARIFNTYGPRMRIGDGRVLPTFITQALLAHPLTVYGDGSQTRSFCYVSDMVDGIYRLLLSGEQEPTNLGNPEEISILQLAREILELTGSRSEIVFHPLPGDDPRVRRPDIRKARQVLGWEPRVPRREGVRRTLPEFQATLAAQGAL